LAYRSGVGISDIDPMVNAMSASSATSSPRMDPNRWTGVPGTRPTSRATAPSVSPAGPTRPTPSAAARRIAESSTPRGRPAIAHL